MEKKYDVVCIGFVDQDIILNGIDEYALNRDSTHAISTTVAVGGDAANQAIILANMGKRASLIATMGKDPIGEQIYQMLHGESVDLTYCIREGISRSNLCVAVIKPDGERSFLFGKGTGELDISMENINLNFLEETKAITLGSLYFLKKMDQGGAAELFKLAREKSIVTFADMTTDAYGIGPEKIASIYPYTDFIMPSYEEACYTSQKNEVDDIADFFLERGVKNVVIKLGAEGCFVKNKDTRFFIDPYDITPIDTTGCGDNFCAGFISSIIDGKTLQDSALFGAAAGAINACCFGANTGVKSKRQIEEFMCSTAQIKLFRL